jgi:preprotein translocase subunit SecD
VAARRLVPAAAAPLLVLGLAGCAGAGAGAGAGADTATCAGGPRPPGVHATLAAVDSAFSASDVNNLSRRLYAAGATCVAIGAPGQMSLDVREQGLTGARAALLLAPGHLSLATWRRRGAGSASPAPSELVVDPRQVAAAEGGRCGASTPELECAPVGFAPVATGVDVEAVTSAAVRTDPVSGRREVVLKFTEAGAGRLAEVTRTMPAQPPPLNMLAVFLDRRMLNEAPVVSPLTSGDIQLSGGAISSDARYAEDVAILARSGGVNAYTVASQSDLR